MSMKLIMCFVCVIFLSCHLLVMTGKNIAIQYSHASRCYCISWYNMIFWKGKFFTIHFWSSLNLGWSRRSVQNVRCKGRRIENIQRIYTSPPSRDRICMQRCNVTHCCSIRLCCYTRANRTSSEELFAQTIKQKWKI